MFIPFPFVVLRTPLQSLRRAGEVSLNSPCSLLFEEGIYLSSPEFWQEYEKRQTAMGQARGKLERSFAKYWLRSCVRCTPYGTFAGTALVDVVAGAETELVLAREDAHRRSLRLDMNYLARLIQSIVRVPGILEQLNFYPNNSIYTLPTGIRYAEYEIRGNVRFYKLNSIQKADYIERVFRAARQGATIAMLAGLLMELEGVSAEEAREFILSMIESQLLLPELEACVTGEDPLDRLIGQLARVAGVDGLLENLKTIRKMLCCPVTGVGHYKDIEDKLRSLGMVEEVPKNTIQTDMFLSMEKKTIARDVIEEIAKQVGELCVFVRPAESKDLKDFREQFFGRYEETEVPLAEALDVEFGLGYAGMHDEASGDMALVDGLALGGVGGAVTFEVNAMQQYVLFKFQEHIEKRTGFIQIEENELKGFAGISKEARFPASMYMVGQLRKKEGRLSADCFHFDLGVISGPSAGNLLGRFTASDQRLFELTKTALKEEEKEFPEAVYAEIVHLPEARTGNILLRPVLRGYEIPYIGKSGALQDAQLPIEDLLVSVRNGQVVLRSKRLDQQVIPRLTTAHNFVWRSLPVYKFLCDLQLQGLSVPIIWDWGQLGVLKQLPRVIYKNIVVRKAQWRIEESEVKGLPIEVEDRIKFFRELCKSRHMPSKVVFTEGDNRLLLDLGRSHGIDLFVYYLKRGKAMSVEEFLLEEEQGIVSDVDGAPFANEFIIPLCREVTVAGRMARKEAVDKRVKAKFAPGSEWLYCKVYSGPKTAERLLKSELLPFIESSMAGKLFEKFFFIRYRDDGYHLRLRFYNSEVGKQIFLQQELSQLLGKAMDDGVIDRVVLDTYNREINRYGATRIEAVESLFYNDSVAALRFIDLIDGQEGERYRLFFALRGIDMLLDDFGIGSIEKQALLKTMQSNFFREFGGSPVLQKQLNERYRTLQKSIFNHMDPAQDGANAIEDGVGVFRERSRMNTVFLGNGSNLLPGQTGNLSREQFLQLLQSYIHMSMNRLFVSRHRQHELVIYHFLEKFYASKVAIEKSGRK